MTGTQQFIGWLCSLATLLTGYALYLATGFKQNRDNQE